MRWHRLGKDYYLRNDAGEPTGYRIFILKKGKKKMVRASHYDVSTDESTPIRLEGEPTLKQAKTIVKVIAKLES